MKICIRENCKYNFLCKTWRKIHQSVHLSINLSNRQKAWRETQLKTVHSVHSIHSVNTVSLFVCVSVCPCVRVSLSPCLCVSVCCIHLSICQSVHLSIRFFYLDGNSQEWQELGISQQHQYQ